jgi:hypothetical protein
VSEEADEPESKSSELHPDLMFDGRKWQPIMSLGTVSQLLEGCAKANESVQRGGPNISGGQRTARVEIWFGRNEPRQTKDAANTGTGQVQSELGKCHAGNITSWHHKSRSIHGHGYTSRAFLK